MGDESGVGVDTSSAERSGAEAQTLAERYADISTRFQTEMTLLSEASGNEMPVANGALDYAAAMVGQLTQLREHTRALGSNAVAGAGAARRADLAIGTGLGRIFAN